MVQIVIKHSLRKKYYRHVLLVMPVIFSVGLIYGQNKKKIPRLELGLNFGHSLMQHNKSKTDGVQRVSTYRMESQEYGSANLLYIVGSNVSSLGFVMNYHFEGNGFLQIGYNRRVRFVSADNAVLQIPRNTTGPLHISSVNYRSDSKVNYRNYDIAFPASFDAFFHKSRSIPFSYQKKFNLSSKRKLTITPGVGFCYFKNEVSQVIRRGENRLRTTIPDLIHNGKNVTLQIQYSSEFISDPFYAANFDLYWYACLGIQKEFKKGNKLELLIDYMPNFRDPHYDDYIKYTVETSLYDVSDRENPVLVETIDKGTTRFELRQGGLTFNLRYYPKPFKMNGK